MRKLAHARDGIHAADLSVDGGDIFAKKLKLKFSGPTCNLPWQLLFYRAKSLTRASFRIIIFENKPYD
jgi:hypothetical protein